MKKSKLSAEEKMINSILNALEKYNERVLNILSRKDAAELINILNAGIMAQKYNSKKSRGEKLKV